MDNSDLKKLNNSDSSVPFKGKTNVFSATSSSISDLVSAFDRYSEILSCFKEGSSVVELRKRYMLKVIDEAWVRAVEDTIPYLETIIRHPNAFLQEYEEVMPIEMTKRVTSRSIEHLCQHTDYIDEVRNDGTVMPSKLLNVFQDETILTYENKFINTLISRLYGFVEFRYNHACECGEDEKATSFSLNQTFNDGDISGKISLSIEVSERPQENEVVKNYIYSSDLWRRVIKIHNIVTKYMDSPFVRSVGKNYIRPPVMRTNMILKNVGFRQCLALWEFLEQYENTGYETLIQEDLENVDESTVKDFFNSVAEQYVIFQKHIRNRFEEEQVLDSRNVETPISPEIKDELDPLDEGEYDYKQLVPCKPKVLDENSDESDAIEEAILIALAADYFDVNEEIDENEQAVIEDGKIKYRYRFSFLSRLIFAQNPTQDYYTEIKNELLSYSKVKSRISWNHERFNVGRKKCALVNVKGKTLFIYLPLNPNAYNVNKYHQVDASDTKRGEDLPFMIKVKSPRGLKYAKELIAIVMANYGISRLENAVTEDYHLPYATPEELARRNPPLVRLLDGSVVLPENFDEEPIDIEEPETETESSEELQEVAVTEEVGYQYKYRYSFLARLIFAQNPTQDFYTEIKNELLSYKKVKSRISWNHETFNRGLNKCAKVNVRGKTLYLYLALNPEEYIDSKYHVKEATGKNNFELKVLLKIRSERAVKYAKELIAVVMAKFGIERMENAKRINYRMRYTTPEQLARRNPPLVKLLRGELPPMEDKFTVNGKYRYSFTSKLILNQNPMQDFYGEIKNELLSYKKVKSRISWNHETFNRGLNKCAKLNVRGKTLCLYLALNPEEYIDSKYHVKEATGKSNTELKVLLKIRSERAVKYAKELIAVVMAKFGIERLKDFEKVDYKMPYQSVKKMMNAEKPLIKKN